MKVTSQSWSRVRIAHFSGPNSHRGMTFRKQIVALPIFIFFMALILRFSTAAIFLYGGVQTIDNANVTEGYEAVGIAHSLASGKGFSAPWPGAGPTAWLTPVMPGLLALDMYIFGLHSRTTLIVFVIFNEICSALTVFPVFSAARRIVGNQGAGSIAAVGAWLWALNPTAGVAACRFIWYTTLSGLLGALLLWATLTVRDSEKRRAWIGYGLLWGAQLMTHPSFLVLMPIALLWLAWPLRDSQRVRLAAVACLTAVFCCVPWTIRNFVVFHHFVPLRSNFGFEFWRYNHGGIPSHPNHDPAERDEFSSLGEYAYTHQKQNEALVWISRHPRAFLHETARRIMHFWFDLAHPLRSFLHDGAWFFKLKLLYICALLLLVFAGLVTLWRKRREYFWLLASFPALFPLVYYIALARDFHRYPIDPILAVIAALAVLQFPSGKSAFAFSPTTVTGTRRPNTLQ